ncbi:BMP-binding endothelial regulator protein-like [Clavelina lepadiformis]|uniref:BMP-binding endothelial regulator protein n=1 Tax=Clavelina lepadiformis TaxID=159417 RepID=A0ABP0F6D5_CLALP
MRRQSERLSVRKGIVDSMLPKYTLSFWFVLGVTTASLISVVSGQASVITGVPQSCEREGEPAVVPIVRNDPCFTCMCKNKEVQCVQEKCPRRYNCSLLLHDEGACCNKCKSCRYNGATHPATKSWIARGEEGVCLDHICQDGIVTRRPLQCHVTCENAITPPNDECRCPVCKGCFHQDRFIEEDEVITVDSCSICTCKGGYLECRKKTCPVLACDVTEARLDRDGCCLVCTRQKMVFELENGACWFRRSILHDREQLKADKCTTCACRNGTIICDRELCTEPLDCPPTDRITSPDQCCPRCSLNRRRNCATDEGRQIMHGERWTTRSDSCVTCACNDGEVTCLRRQCSADLTCPPGQHLDKAPESCCPTCTLEPGICTVFGDPHYRTFDGRPFNFQGDCSYMLAKDCREQNFTVTVENNAKRSATYSWTNTVHLRLINPGVRDEQVVSLYQHLAVKINGEKVALPYIDRTVLIWSEHHIVKVRTNAGVSLNWDGDSFLEVGASPVYRGTLCGLCGNFNGFARDDFIGGDGVFKFNKEEFANSWKIGAGNKRCSRRAVVTRATEPCAKNIKRKISARKSCQVFKSDSFRSCYDVVDPADYYRSCMTDSCGCPRNRKCSCESVRAYAAACARRGVKVTWDEYQHCQPKCKHGKVFTSCGSPCKTTCRNHHRVRRKKSCQRHCVAGCACPAGYVINNRKCVKATQCPAVIRKKLKRRFGRRNPLQRYLKFERIKRAGKRSQRSRSR